ncbi:MAG: hypothetical protein R3B41_04070 [Candidatus Doudnabacteria bacterium]
MRIEKVSPIYQIDSRLPKKQPELIDQNTDLEETSLGLQLPTDEITLKSLESSLKKLEIESKLSQ